MDFYPATWAQQVALRDTMLADGQRRLGTGSMEESGDRVPGAVSPPDQLGGWIVARQTFRIQDRLRRSCRCCRPELTAGRGAGRRSRTGSGK